MNEKRIRYSTLTLIGIEVLIFYNLLLNEIDEQFYYSWFLEDGPYENTLIFVTTFTILGIIIFFSAFFNWVFHVFTAVNLIFYILLIFYFKCPAYILFFIVISTVLFCIYYINLLINKLKQKKKS